MIRDKVNRARLEEVIPVKTPFLCHIEVTNVCNFKCEFCTSVDNPEFDKKRKGFMDFDLFCKIVDDLNMFEDKLKQMYFHNLGEPLLHPRIADMIAYAKKKKVADKLILFTNASRLTPKLSRAICDAGIDYIQLSIEHVNSAGYERIVRTKVDYDRLLANVGYLCAYKNKNCFVSAKILDCGLTEEDKRKFYEDFGKIADECHEEALVQALPEAMRDTTLGLGKTTTTDGNIIEHKEVCTPPFYLLSVYFDGLVSPCTCDWSRGIYLGDANKESLKEIWDGEKRKSFLKMQLRKERNLLPACGKCVAADNHIDNIDPYAEMLYQRF